MRGVRLWFWVWMGFWDHVPLPTAGPKLSKFLLQASSRSAWSWAGRFCFCFDSFLLFLRFCLSALKSCSGPTQAEHELLLAPGTAVQLL